MVKLLIIADDFTGALDTGVQFAAGGAETRVVTNTDYDFDRVDENVQVLVLDAETRHLSRDEAYRVVFHITKKAFESGIPFIYKKTDSALRGNIGSELKAVLDDDTVPKTVLTEEQEEKLLAFAKADKTYSKNYDEILILLKTGLRISEFGGLTLPDLDFENRLVNIDHQLLRDTEIGYYIETPKTKSGERQVPMVEEAYQAFKRVLANRKNDKRVEIDGYSDFLFLNRKNYPKVASDYNGMMKGLVKKYNKYNEDKLPHITPHSLRHTFCTNYANAGMNPKALQYIMGHANIAMTLNYYAHATFDSAMAEMKRLNKEKQQERLVA